MRRHSIAVLAAVALFAIPVSGSAQETVKLKGVIVARSGADMIVHVQEGVGNTTVVLSNDTKVEVKGGPLGIKKSSMGPATLIPGLKVEVEGAPAANAAVAATKVEFSSGDLKTANEIQAGLAPTAALADTNAEGVAENRAETDSLSKRFGELGDYDIIAQDTVYFGVNSSVVYPAGQQTLKAFAAKAKALSSYNILVAGYTDASGNAEYNQQLSERRAQAVIEYLEQKMDIPLYLVLAPAAMGFSHPVASNETQEGAAKNRRVVASIVVNRGVTGQ
jgi:outer membrane protein OmpA-like peptidoglycan-associated protein